MGVVGAFIVLAGYLVSLADIRGLWVANLGLLVHWFGDSLDGTLARVRRIERPRFGFYLDQVIDTIGNLAIGGGVAICPVVSAPLVLVGLVLYSMLSIQVLVRTIVDREFNVAVGRFGPTELRLAIIAMNLFILAFGTIRMNVLGIATSVVDLAILMVDVWMLALMIWQMWGHLLRLSVEDPPRA